MRLALLGDIHLYQSYVAPWRLLNRRILGQMNVWFGGRHRFDCELLAPVFDRVLSINPDMVLLSGDLTTVSLPEEFAAAAAALERLRTHVPILAVPGNHDRYTFSAARLGLFERMLGPISPPRFPHQHQLTPRWRILAIDSAVPRILTSRGRIGTAQLQAIAQILKPRTADDGVILLCHYPLRRPPEIHAHWHHLLADAARLDDMVAACPARIVFVHGHVHRPWRWSWRGSAGREILSLNCGAPSLRGVDHPYGQGFWQLDLPADVAGPIEAQRHRLLETPPDSSPRWDVNSCQSSESLRLSCR